MSRRNLILVLAVVLGAVILTSLASFPELLPPANPKNPELRLLVNGLVQRPLTLTLGEIAALPRKTVDADLFCVDSPMSPVAQGNWTGLRLGFLLEEAGLSPSAVKVVFSSKDGYTTDLTITTAMQENVILAYERNGEHLPEKLRLVVPGKWGYKWISGVVHIELVSYDFKGTWESKGYSDEADIPFNP